MSDVALSVVLGIGLAAATGFRVFLPMLIMSGAAYTGHLPLGDSFAWLATPSALIMLSVAALAEIAAYYIPGVDNLLDTLATPAAFAAGTVVSAAVMTELPPMLKWTAAVIAGGGRRRPHARRDRNAPGAIHHVHGRDRQPGARNRGARRRPPGLGSDIGGAARRPRAGHPVFMAGSTSAALVVSRGASIERPKTCALQALNAL